MPNLFQIVQTQDRNLNQIQQNIATSLRPIQKNVLLFGSLLQNVNIVSGVNNIPHGLSAPLTGWQIVRRRAYYINGTQTDYDIYDTQDANKIPNQTLQLISNEGSNSNPVLIDLYVF
jgi:hypothetical protein